MTLFALITMSGASAHGTIERYWVDTQGNGYYLAGNCFSLSEEEIKAQENGEAFEKHIMDRAFKNIRRVQNHVTEDENCLESFDKLELSDFEKNTFRSGYWARLCQYAESDTSNYIDIWIETKEPIPPYLTENISDNNNGANVGNGQNSISDTQFPGNESTYAGGEGRNSVDFTPDAGASAMASSKESGTALSNAAKSNLKNNQTNSSVMNRDETFGMENETVNNILWVVFSSALIANVCLGINLIKDFKILHWYKEKKKEHLRKEAG